MFLEIEIQDYPTKGGTFVGTILGWTGLVNGIPIPWGLGVDLATGALWKPNVIKVA